MNKKGRKWREVEKEKRVEEKARPRLLKKATLALLTMEHVVKMWMRESWSQPQ